MTSAATEPERKPRRGKARLRTGIPAVFVTMGGRQVVSMIDLSESGAGLSFENAEATRGGILKWMDYEAYGTVVRRSGDDIGLQFEEPIDAVWVLETRPWLPRLERANDPFLHSAKSREPHGEAKRGSAQVPGTLASKYGSGVSRSTPVHAAAPYVLGALVLGALAGYGSSLF